MGKPDYDLTKADIGYDRDNLEDAIDELQTVILENLVDEMEKGSKNTCDNMDTYWVGASADMLKSKIYDDFKNFKDSMKILSDGLEEEINKMGANLSSADKEVADDLKNRYGVSGDSFGGGFFGWF